MKRYVLPTYVHHQQYGEHVHDSSVYREYPAKRALSAMRKHGG